MKIVQRHKFIPHFEKGGLGGILNVAAYNCGRGANPPQSPFFKGGERSEGALIRGTNYMCRI